MTQPSPLTGCDTEPIHIPGSIQPHGALLVLDPNSWRITHASANVEAVIGKPHAGLVGRLLFACLGRETSHALTNALTTSLGPSLPGRTFGMQLATGRVCDATVHAHDGRILIEFEPTLDQQNEALPLLLVRTMLTRMQQATSIVGICEATVEQMRALIGYDRVMVYRFLHDGSGCVIAEKKRTEAVSFMGHHYPASDIPAQARALYTKNWLRLIADVHGETVALLPGTVGSANPVDLSYCSLRSVSPVHIEYLKNMGVAASVSISIVVAGKLWGMIACHHSFPRALTSETRVAAELFGQTFSLQLQSIERLDATEVLRKARARLDLLICELPTTASLFDSLSPRLAEIAAVMSCDGAGVLIDGKWLGTGTVPPDAAITDLGLYLRRAAGSEIYATHSLAAELRSAAAYAADVSGLLAVPLSRLPGDYLLFFRREYIHTIGWAGRPDKPMPQADPSLRLSPRKSFELWKENVHHTSEVWDASDKLTAEALRISLLEVVLKFTEEVVKEKAKAAAQQRVFVAELNHRVKNALALVNALIKQSKGAHDKIGPFVADLEARILSLAKAHDQANSNGTLDLRTLLENELAPFNDNDHTRIVIEGPLLYLEPRSFAVLALVFHEMTTNAAKYGALSLTTGRIDISWHIDANEMCRLTWRELGSPPARVNGKPGFGSKLILHQIPFELSGTVSVDYRASGVEIAIAFPTCAPLARATAAPPVADTVEHVNAPHQILKGRTILLVEDSLLIALEVEELLRAAGAAHVAVCNSTESALAELVTLKPDAAILDVNLKTETSFPVADALTASGISFVFATGYGTAQDLPARFGSVPVLAKPYSMIHLIAALERAAVIPPGDRMS